MWQVPDSHENGTQAERKKGQGSILSLSEKNRRTQQFHIPPTGGGEMENFADPPPKNKILLPFCTKVRQCHYYPDPGFAVWFVDKIWI